MSERAYIPGSIGSNVYAAPGIAAPGYAPAGSIQTLSIDKVDNGWVVRYGCVTLVFNDRELRLQLDNFIRDPQGVVEEYRRVYRPSPQGLGGNAAPGYDTADYGRSSATEAAVPSGHLDPASGIPRGRR